MSFLPESVTTDLERLILSVRPVETSKLVSIVSKHLTQVISIAFPRPPAPPKPPAKSSTSAVKKANNNTSESDDKEGKKKKQQDEASENSDNDSENKNKKKKEGEDEDEDESNKEEDEESETTTASSSPPPPPLGGYDTRARTAVELLCAVATCEALDNGARDVARAVLKLIHKDNINRLRGSNLAVARFTRVLLEAYTEDYEAVTNAIDDSFTENPEAVSIWLSMVAKHPQFGDLILQLWGNALSASSAVLASPAMFALPWIKHQAQTKLIRMLQSAIENEDELPLFTFVQEIFQRGLNAHVGHFVDHILLGTSGEDFIDSVIKSAEGVADGSSSHTASPCLPEALALLSSMLAMLQRSSLSQTSFEGDYHRTLKTNTAVHTFIKHLPRLSSLLNSDALAARPGAFGSARLRIVDACMTLFRFCRSDSDQALFEINFIPQLFKLCESFPNHDVVLAALAEICTEAIVRVNDDCRLERYLIDQCHLHDKLIEWVRDDKWGSTSLRALALTVSFGLAQKGIKGAGEDEDDDDEQEQGADKKDGEEEDGDKKDNLEDDTDSIREKSLDSSNGEDEDNAGEDKNDESNNSNKKETDKKNSSSDDDDFDEEDPLDSPELRKNRSNNKKNKKNEKKQDSHGENNKKDEDDEETTSPTKTAAAGLSQISIEVIEKSTKFANASAEWKEFIANDLPAIWKQWFTEINGYFFQEPRSGGGKQVMHRPVVNLTKQSQNSNRYGYASTVGKNGMNSNNNNNNSSGEGSEEEGSGSDNESSSNKIAPENETIDQKLQRLVQESRNNAQSRRRAAAAAARRNVRSGDSNVNALFDTVVDVENGKIISTKSKNNNGDNSSSPNNNDGDDTENNNNNKDSYHNPNEKDGHIIASPTAEDDNEMFPPRKNLQTDGNTKKIVNNPDNEFSDIMSSSSSSEENNKPSSAPPPRPGGKRLHRRTHSGHQDPNDFNINDPTNHDNNNDSTSGNNDRGGNDESSEEEISRKPRGKNAAGRVYQQQQQQKQHHVDPTASSSNQEVDNDDDELHLDLDDVQPIAHSEEDDDSHHHNNNNNQQTEDENHDAWIEKFITEEVHDDVEVDEDTNKKDDKEQNDDDVNESSSAGTSTKKVEENDDDDEELEIDLNVDDDENDDNNNAKNEDADGDDEKKKNDESPSSASEAKKEQREPVVVVSSGTLRSNAAEDDDDDW